MSKIDVIDFLNATVKMKLAPSPIHGIGVFAIKDIAAGTKLFADRMPFPYKLQPADQTKLFPEVRELLVSRWPRMVLGEPFGWPDVHFQGYMNHADEPTYDGTLDIVIRDLKAGDEITEDYRRIPGWEEAFPWLVENSP